MKQRAVKRAYDQIGAFEDHWRYLKEKTAREEAEEEAELVRLSEGWSRARAVQMERQLAATLAENSSVKSATTNLIRNSRSESTLASRAYLDRSEVLHAYRPPSPLHLYDYGGISVRPRSQQQQLRGATGRPAYRREFLGVYFPGPEFKQGPYGSSLQDPILMPPMHWVESQQYSSPPERYNGDASDLRPRTAEGHNRPMKLWRWPEGVGGQDGTDAARRHQVQDTSEGQSSACDHPEDQEGCDAKTRSGSLH